jgi:integrase
MRSLPKARVARLAECHKKQKAGYDQDASPNNATLHKSSATLHITSPALEYWENELASKDPATIDLYLRSFNKFLQYTGRTPDELITQRQQDVINPNRKIQRQMESTLNQFIGKMRQNGLATATLQVYFASVRSFFEIHYYPLIMRKGDYPKGESIGVRVATKEAILKTVESNHNRNKSEVKAIILFLKDSGLRASDTVLLNYGKIADGLEHGDSIIPLTLITEKQHTIAKTFIGEEAIQAIKQYLKERRTGSKRLPPETITDKSPLFRTWESAKVKRLTRMGLTSLVRQAFLRVNEANISPHSLRKYLQTNLEAGNVNVNWIDQILGHKLINSRDAYSKPTDEQLREAYIKAYKFLRIYLDLNKPNLQTNHDTKIHTETSEATGEEEFTVKTAQNLNEATELIRHGFQYAATIEGIQLFRKRK